MTASQEFSFYDARGELISCAAEFRDDNQAAPGRPGLVARTVRLNGRRVVRQVRLPRPRGNQHAREALEREASAAVAIERAYGATEHNRVFTPLVGQHLDVSEPFVLYRPVGRPLGHHGGRLNVAQVGTVLRELTLAVRLLEHLGYVHRAVTPGTVLWDGHQVRLSEPFAAVPAGQGREPFGRAPWSASEQLRGDGLSDPRDDLWSVGQVMYYLLAGRPGAGTGPPPGLASYPQLAALHGAFAPVAAERPAPAEVLRRLTYPDPFEASPRAADPLDAGRRAFDEALTAKRRDLGRAGRPDHPPDERERGDTAGIGSTRRGLRSWLRSAERRSETP